MKKTIIFIFLLLISIFTLASCEKSGKTKIGILQLVTHAALNQATEGFIEGLEQEGFVNGENIEIIIKNPEGDNQTLNQMANVLVRECDLVLGIATDAAVALVNARDNNGIDIPVFFTAVTDPVQAGLVEAWETTNNNVTGTSDKNDVDGQIALIKKIVPNCTEMAILFHSSEVNSQVQASQAQTAAQKESITATNKKVNDVSELQATLTAIANSKVPVVYLPTDNLVASNITTITEFFNENNIVTVCGEESMVTSGGSISLSINYKSLGIQTAKMAAKCLNGTSVENIPVEQGKADNLVINKDALQAMGFDADDIENNIKSK